MNNVIELANGKIAALKAEILSMQREVSELESFIKMYLRLSDGAKPSIALMPEGGALNPASQVVGRTSTARSVVVETVKEILANGAPITTRSLLEKLGEMGIKITGNDDKIQVVNLSGMLSRDRENFSNDRVKGWSLKSKNPEDVDASPGSVPEQLAQDLV